MDDFMAMKINKDVYNADDVGLGHIIESEAKKKQEEEESEFDKYLLENQHTFVIEKNETIENKNVIIQS